MRTGYQVRGCCCGGADDINITYFDHFQSTFTTTYSLFFLYHPYPRIPNFAMSLVNVSSKEQFSSLLTSSAIVVTDCEFLPALGSCPSLPWLYLTSTAPRNNRALFCLFINRVFILTIFVIHEQSGLNGADHAKPSPLPTNSWRNSSRVRTGSHLPRSTSMSSRISHAHME